MIMNVKEQKTLINVVFDELKFEDCKMFCSTEHI